MTVEDPLEGASLLVVVPSEYGFDDSFATNLKRLHVRHKVVGSHYSFPALRLSQQVKRVLCKLTGDFGYRRRLQVRHNMSKMWERIGEESFDYALCIRPDLLPMEDLRRMRSQVRRFYGYTWDGVRRFGGLLERQHFFEKLHVFDPSDAAPGSGRPLLGNFFFDCYPESLPVLHLPAADAYFLSTYDCRWPIVDRMCRELLARGLRLDVQQLVLNARLRRVSVPTYVKKIQVQKAYHVALAEALRCGILLDIHHEHVHGGFSFRIFEAIGYGRKLITTNRGVLTEDFYRPENIYCFGHEARSLDEFLAQPMRPVPASVRSRYGFSNWLRRALDLPDLPAA